MIPNEPPPHLLGQIDQAFQFYITAHDEYKERTVDAQRLKEDALVFQSAYICGYIARCGEEGQTQTASAKPKKRN